MPRQASPRTVAIREIFQEMGLQTHLEIRPLLVKKGIEIAPQPERLSSELSEVIAKLNSKGDLSDSAKVKAAAESLKYEPKVVKAVVKEAAIRVAFEAERNDFNVGKFQWTQSQKSGKRTSVKPNSKKKTAKARGSKPTVTKTVTKTVKTGDSLDVVAKMGGVAATQKRIEALRAEAEQLEGHVTEVHELQKKLEAAA